MENKETKTIDVNSNKNGVIDYTPIKIDTIDFNLVNGERLNRFKELDSIQMTKWTDNYMPKGLIDLRLYNAHLIDKKETNKGYEINTILTNADDWTRLHLITCSADSNLIDYKEIGENMSYLIEQSDSFEIYMEINSKLIILNDSTFKKEQVDITTKDFFDEAKKDSTNTIKTDSIFTIDQKGKIKNRL